MDFAKWFTPGKIIAMVVFGAILFIGLNLWGYANGLWNTMVGYETTLNASYKSNQNYLSAYESGFYETIGVANLKSAKLDKILTDAVKGRYDGNTSAKPGSGSLFSAIAEAYPNIDLTIYDKIADYIKAGRAGYRNKQDTLLDQLRSFDNFRRSGILQHLLIGWGGFPTQNLVACAAADDCKRGEEAIKRMTQIVVTEGTETAYKTSKMAPLSVPKD